MSNTLTTLDVELLIEILAYVDDTSPATTRSVSLVNKHLNATSKLVVHRHKSLLFVGPELKSPLDDWRGDPLVLHGVRRLTISEEDRVSFENAGPLSSADIDLIYSGSIDRLSEKHQKLADNVHRIWDDLADFISQGSNLRTLTWNLQCPVPFAVLNALHLHQKKAKLTISNWCRARHDADHNDATEIALAHSSALTKIRAVITPRVEVGYHQYVAGHDLRLAAFKRVVAHAPNLRFASVVWDPNMSRPPDDQARHFFTHKQPNSALRHLTLDGWALSEQTLNHWSQYVDLSRLESIKCSRGVPEVSYFNRAPALLPNLKHISLNFSTMTAASVKAAAEDYIAACAPLTSLSLW